MHYDIEELSIAALIDGYTPDGEGGYHCIHCGAAFPGGEVFCVDGRFFTAERAAIMHQAAHGGNIAALLQEENRHITLTEHQRALFERFAAGLADAEIARETGVTASTIRSQRFAFRERAKQAKMYLALYTLALEKKTSGKGALIPVSHTAKMVDERYVVTVEEREKILKNTFESLSPLRLKVLSAKEKKKIVILSRIAEEFERGRTYTEREVNEVLEPIFEDYAMIRRYLIEYGFMERFRDGSRYWLK